MESNKNNVTDFFRFQGIERVFQRINSRPADFELNQVEFTFEAKQGYNTKVRAAIVSIQTKMLDRRNKSELAAFHFIYGFHVMDFDSIAPKSPGGTLNVSLKVIQQLVVMSFDTNRGMIYAAVAGSYLQKIIIPISTISRIYALDENITHDADE
jgi:hypothetical protein